MKRYEYSFVSYRGKTVNDLLVELNRLGDCGWVVVADIKPTGYIEASIVMQRELHLCEDSPANEQKVA